MSYISTAHTNSRLILFNYLSVCMSVIYRWTRVLYWIFNYAGTLYVEKILNYVQTIQKCACMSLQYRWLRVTLLSNLHYWYAQMDYVSTIQRFRLSIIASECYHAVYCTMMVCKINHRLQMYVQTIQRIYSTYVKSERSITYGS